MMARGTVLSAPYETKHYDPMRAAAGETHDVIDVAFDDIRDPEKDAFLGVDELKKISAETERTPQQSGIEIRRDTTAALETAWAGLKKPEVDDGPTPRIPYTVDDVFAEGCFHPENRGDSEQLESEEELKFCRGRPAQARRGWPSVLPMC